MHDGDPWAWLAHASAWAVANRADLIGLAGLTFSLLAFIEARAAKRAARRAARVAARSVQRQSAVRELTEIARRLESLEEKVSFMVARNLLLHADRRLRQITMQLRSVPRAATACEALEASLADARSELDRVKPRPDQSVSSPNMVYFGVEAAFALINARIGDLLGILERETVDNPDEHDD